MLLLGHRELLEQLQLTLEVLGTVLDQHHSFKRYSLNRCFVDDGEESCLTHKSNISSRPGFGIW